MALAFGVADVAGVDSLQGAEIGLRQPGPGHVASKQVAHHLGVRKQQLVTGVVLGGGGHGGGLSGEHGRF